MKILLASKYGPHGKRPIGGVQTWVATVAKELLTMGHEVGLYEGGESEPNMRYDLGIFANFGHTGHMIKRCNQVIQVSHGIIEPERPTYPKVVFTSEGVRDFWNCEGPILPQPIDLGFWHPAKIGKDKPYLTRFSYRNGLGFIPEIASDLGLQYIHMKDCKDKENIKDVLQKSACVIATGRAALEAIACSAPVIICDHRGSYQGPLLDRDLMHAMQNNYSGRGGITPTLHNVKHAVKQAIAFGNMRLHVEQYHDSKRVVEKLLSMKWEAAPGCKLECVTC